MAMFEALDVARDRVVRACDLMERLCNFREQLGWGVVDLDDPVGAGGIWDLDDAVEAVVKFKRAVDAHRRWQ